MKLNISVAGMGDMLLLACECQPILRGSAANWKTLLSVHCCAVGRVPLTYSSSAVCTGETV